MDRVDHFGRDLFVALDRAGGRPLRSQLEEQLRDGVRSGRLHAGTALPSTRALAAELGIAVEDRDASEPLTPQDFDLLVNATTVGLEQAGARAAEAADLEPLPLDRDSIGPWHVVVDLVYGAHETALAELARARAARLVDGLEVLVRQGAASLRVWTGLEPPLEVMRRAARAA